MKKSLHLKRVYFAFIAILLGVVLPLNAFALTSSEINDSIVLDGSIPLEWENDTIYQWTLEDGYLKSGNYGRNNSASKISFKYSSQHTTNISFKYKNNYDYSSYHYVDVYVDGEWKYGASNTSSTQDISFRLPKGNHTITVRDSILDTPDYYTNNWYTKLWDVKLTESPAVSSDSINSSSCVVQDNVNLTWDNSGLYGWTLEDGYLKSGNYGFKNSASKISFKYSSQHTTNISFKYKNNYDYSSYHHVDVYVDGEWKYGASNTSSTQDISFRLPKGNHTITVRDSILNTPDYYTNNYYTKLWDVKVHEYPAPESVILTQRSMPITFTDEGKQPWFIDINNCACSNNGVENNSNSILRSTITVDKPTKLSFRVYTNSYSSNYHYLTFRINDRLNYISTNSDWRYVSTVLQPGTHTLEWKDENTYSGTSYYSVIKDVELHQDWVEVDVTPGMLGVEILYKVNVLTDIELLKITGTLNETDWATIKMMTNLHGLDLSGTTITSIPANAFSTIANLNTIDLPDGLERIGEYSFYNSHLRYINIPSSVIYIGKEAFYQTYIHTITFAPDSKLETIGDHAFCNCDFLEEFIMPNTVTKLETSSSNNASTFYNCERLKKIVFSDGLTTLPGYTCYECYAVEELYLPANVTSIGYYFMYDAGNLKELDFPESLKSIGDQAFSGVDQIERLELPEKLTSLGYRAFQNSDNLKEVILPSGISNYNGVFRGCGNIKTIICRAATPPSISNDPFNSVAKANVTLKVPAFAVATYKLDPYWYQFGNIIEGEPTDYWKIIGDLRLLNNRRMEGKPDIDLYYGGKLTVGGDAPMTIGKFDIYNWEGNPSSFVTDCSAINADEINSIFYVDANKWYFITPMVDINLQQIIVNGASNYVFRYYDGATRAEIGAGTSWKNVNDMKLSAGVGYIFQCNAASEIIFPVPVEMHNKILTTEAVTLPLVSHPSDNKANKGWNYVGNPFPSYYDIYYMDFTAPITVWTGSTYRAYSITDDDFILRPMQGFFVQKPDAVDAIVLQTAGRQIESSVKRAKNVMAKSKSSRADNRIIFNIELGTDTIEDMTRIVLNENALSTYEIECDASKFMSMNTDVAQIYSIDSENNYLSINERPQEEGIVSLGVYLPNANNSYSISATISKGEAILYDSELNVSHNLSEGSYEFSTKSEGFNNNRFSINLKAGNFSAIENLLENKNNIVVAPTENGINILNAIGCEYKVAGIDGYIYSKATAQNEKEYVPLQKGIYLVMVGGDSFKIIVK